MALEEADLDIDFDAELASIQRAGQLTAEQEARALQGQVMGDDDAVIEVSAEDVDGQRRVDFLGRKFRVADKIGLMPMLKFFAAGSRTTTDTPEGLIALYTLLRDCIYGGEPSCGTCKACKDAPAGQREAGKVTGCSSYRAGDWEAFEEHAIATKAEGDDLFDVMNKAMELIAARPTGQSVPSSGGRRAISGASTARSSARRARGSKR